MNSSMAENVFSIIGKYYCTNETGFTLTGSFAGSELKYLEVGVF